MRDDLRATVVMAGASIDFLDAVHPSHNMNMRPDRKPADADSIRKKYGPAAAKAWKRAQKARKAFFKAARKKSAGK